MALTMLVQFVLEVAVMSSREEGRQEEEVVTLKCEGEVLLTFA
jgi:hypothetical protein